MGEISKINYRDPILRDLPDDLPVTFLPMAAIDADTGTIVEPQERLISEVRKGFTSFSEGDVLFAKITPSMENGKATIAAGLKNRRGFGSTEFHVLSPNEGILPEWIFYFIRQESFRGDARANFTGTAGQLRVPTDFLKDYPFPLPPLPEQHCIVDEIEAQFTRLDAVVAALKRTQTNLKRYRTSVLKIACEGRLVPQNPTDEPAGQLLERILAERRQQWNGRGQYTEPIPPNTTDLPELPVGWVWATVEQLTNLITSGSRGWAQYYSDTGPLFIRAQDINTDVLILNNVAHVDLPAGIEGSRTRVEHEDLLITIYRRKCNKNRTRETRIG